MASPHPLYRSMVRLYPRDFRREYGEDLVGHYDDLVADRGARAARTRTALDLAITIPRYHLEHVMTEQHSAAALSLVIGLFAAAGLGATFIVSYVTYILLIGDKWTVRETVLAIIGNLAMFGAIGFLIAGLLTPRTRDYSDAARPAA